MIQGVSVITVIVRDQEDALQFYTEKLGFVKHTDMRMGPDGPRWVSVAAQAHPVPELTLFHPPSFMGPEAAAEMLGLIGKMPGVVLGTDDCRQTISELEAKGVKILQQPQDQPYGVEAVFADLYGNAYVLVQPAQK
ncbi:MAG TPA: VOC family protein [Symbiobacteriaceae bacterium]|nr:VOC family protein [Symbiobacteriaceae bacterium]